MTKVTGMLEQGDAGNTLLMDIDPNVLSQDIVKDMSRYNFDVFFRSDVPRRFVVVSDSALTLKRPNKKLKTGFTGKLTATTRRLKNEHVKHKYK